MGNVLREKAQIMDSVSMRRAIARISLRSSSATAVWKTCALSAL